MSTSGLVNAHLCLLLVRAAEQLGVDVDSVLRQCELSVDDLRGYGAGVPGDLCLRLVRLLQKLSGEADLGLKAGRWARLSDLDLAGLMLRASADVPAAAAVFDTMMIDAASIFSTQIIQRSDGVIVRYLPELGVSTPRVLHDTFLASAMTLSRSVLGPYVPEAVHSMASAPADRSEYERTFEVPVRFAMPWTQIKIPATVARADLATRDDVVAAVVAPHLRNLTPAPATPGVLGRVSRVLLTLMHGRPPTIAQVAERLGMSPRTLRRRLQDEGSSFQQALDKAKHELALQQLSADATGAEIAASLGYAEPPAFYRAFKRWTGMSLTDYREHLKVGSEVSQPTSPGPRQRRPTS